MDIAVKMDRFQILQNLLNGKYTLEGVEGVEGVKGVERVEGVEGVNEIFCLQNFFKLRKILKFSCQFRKNFDFHEKHLSLNHQDHHIHQRK